MNELIRQHLPWVRRRLGGRPLLQVIQIPGVHGFVYGPDQTELRGIDLISTASYPIPRQRYDTDREIAPTIIPASPDRATWRDTTRLAGRAVGRPVAAERLITDAEARIAAATSRHPQLAGRTGACVEFDHRKSSTGRFRVAPECTELLSWLGMRGVPTLQASAGSEDPFPLTAADVVAARPDVIVTANGGYGLDGVSSRRGLRSWTSMAMRRMP